jgi:ribosomal protein L11 methyltransferase
MTDPLLRRIPYDRLHIYYLEGQAGSAEESFDNRFIGNWEEDGDSFLFFSAPAEDDVRRYVAARSDLTLIDQYDMTYEDWQGGRFQGLRAGRLVVRPAWQDGPAAAPGEIPMQLDPGVVFGAGTHPTTQDCLTALAILSKDGPRGTLLDLGSGTGVLAVAAARLGWRRVLAVDFNRLAVKTTCRNVALNGVASRVLAVQGRAEELVACRADVVVANIHYDVMRRLIQSPGFSRSRNGILSGLLRSQAREAEALLTGAGMSIRRRWSRDNTWFTYLVSVYG